jgi:hypothetical protein
MTGSAAGVFRRLTEVAFAAFLDFIDARDFFLTIRFRIRSSFRRGRSPARPHHTAIDPTRWIRTEMSEIVRLAS